jgi:hypothetical protein
MEGRRRVELVYPEKDETRKLRAEICTCGHSGLLHANFAIYPDTYLWQQDGQGACLHPECLGLEDGKLKCPQFTWARTDRTTDPDERYQDGMVVDRLTG